MGGKKDERGERKKWVERRMSEEKERSGWKDGWARRNKEVDGKKAGRGERKKWMERRLGEEKERSGWKEGWPRGEKEVGGRRMTEEKKEVGG